MIKPEILAPAGNWEALEGAVKAGADAVYVGGSLFSARAYAGNFDKENMIRAIDYCHLYNARLYLALNTLLKTTEIKLVEDYVRPFYQAGLDGIIVQDFGVAQIIKEKFPLLPLHASTQMSISSHFGADFLKSIGFSRIVPARELSIEEIKNIKKISGMEIEVFVHGAMCFAYSGKCLLSSYLGGRSGNRGRCAQPCRQPYFSENTQGYLMSLKDMCTLKLLPELIEAGVDSFKIEGRMKKPEYVAATTSVYKTAVDSYVNGSWNWKTIEKEIEKLQDIYNRGGFSSGYLKTQRGVSMLSGSRPNHTGLKIGSVEKIAPPQVYVRLERDVNVQDVLEIRAQEPCLQENGEKCVELTSTQKCQKNGLLKLNGKEFKKIKKGMPVFRTRNNELLQEIRDEILTPEKMVTAKAVVTAKTGEPLRIALECEGANVSVFGNVVEKAGNRPADPQVICEKMKKTGGSGVRLETECDFSEDAFVPMSELNNLRREAVEKLKEEMTEKYRR